MRQSLIYIFLSLLFFNCGSKKSIEPIGEQTTPATTKSRGLYEQTTAFMVCSQYPKIFQTETVDKKPLPVQGEDAWIRDFYMALRYPPDSREKSVQGTVILEIIFDIDGTIESIAYKQQVAPDIDEAAVEAFRIASKQGFSPAIFEGRAVRSKVTIPLHFRLG